MKFGMHIILTHTQIGYMSVNLTISEVRKKYFCQMQEQVILTSKILDKIKNQFITETYILTVL